MTYDPSNLAARDPTSAAWALAWTRFLLRDTSSVSEYEDDELTATLTAYAFVHDDVTYYRPHEAAANLIESDPERALSESLMSAMVTLRRPASVAISLRRAGAWMDDLIETEAGARPASGRTLEPSF